MLKKIKENWENLYKSSSEFKPQSYAPMIDEIHSYKLNHKTDAQLKEMSEELRKQVEKGIPIGCLLPKAYALVYEAVYRTLGMRYFDVQLLAGVALHQGKLVEMQTGEGKTLTAVLPAYLNALEGKGVHILTFNDYLAYRDAHWMGPVYEFLGLKVGFVQEGMTLAKRKQAYGADITYVTAKEAGFDYLKGFICTKPEELVHRPFHYAIIDEADSILIDEARVPLVIAGNTLEVGEKPWEYARIARELQRGWDYDIDTYARNAFLTDRGVARVEKFLGCGNLYDEQNFTMLSKVNCALYAEVLLKRDIDYIVRDNKVELVDEFTGRVADKRHWPDGLQGAVEAKEGINRDSNGKIMDQITMQNYIKLYPKVCGMTGTAQTSEDEFLKSYGAKVAVIPTNLPCIRKDEEDLVFANKRAKLRALVSEISSVHGTGRPILVGTGSVAESEQLAAELGKVGVACQVLNAKNDELEAKIIAKAGMLGAVIVSTNMAGRGTDIRLGGEQGEEREKIIALGGLYVIGTNKHESRRIDNQLRGRAGRQGDPGSTRFFISLQDELIKKYRVDMLIPEGCFSEGQEEPIEDPLVRQEIARAQRIIEGQNFDIRKILCKYAYITEQQRQIIRRKRDRVLKSEEPLTLLLTAAKDRYNALCSAVGANVLQEVERKLTLYYINQCWTDYLDYAAYIRESIHLVNLGGKNPLDEYHKEVIPAFDAMITEIDEEVVKAFYRVEIAKEGINMDKEGLKGPSSTWTYLIDDGGEQLGISPILGSAIAAAVNAPLFMLMALFTRFFKKPKK